MKIYTEKEIREMLNEKLYQRADLYSKCGDRAYKLWIMANSEERRKEAWAMNRYFRGKAIALLETRCNIWMEAHGTEINER